MKNILIPIEFDEMAQKLIDMGTTLAEKFHSKIWLIHIAAPEPDFVQYTSGTRPNDEREARAEVLKRERRLIQKYSDALNEKGISSAALMVQGQTIETIMEKVESLNIDLIITGNNKHGFIFKFFLESVSDSIVKKSDIPVLLVPVEEK
ncbi:universal stress protein [Hyunsoonleella flava]|uniref:Universal stress protein n=1 Tax=Hyunsoonleella flava TaxID=2527939 RepID=A0A4Q9FLZ0_9FLAO|nr:universal stress protein [Hyunsoonleella flava]TBN06847.1 universal stress protein [Hyunsoonleella flava]